MLTLAQCRLLAVLPCHVLHVIKGNGPQSRLAAQSGFKNNLLGKGKSMSIWRDRREGGQRTRVGPHLELLGVGHFDLDLQPLVPLMPALAPHN